jgi:hypothetical protein
MEHETETATNVSFLIRSESSFAILFPFGDMCTAFQIEKSSPNKFKNTAGAEGTLPHDSKRLSVPISRLKCEF